MSERAMRVDMGPSQAQPPASRVRAPREARRSWRPRRQRVTTLRLYGPPRACATRRAAALAASPGRVLAGEGQQRVQEHVAAMLDGDRVTRLVGAVALAADRRNEDHAGLRD